MRHPVGERKPASFLAEVALPRMLFHAVGHAFLNSCSAAAQWELSELVERQAVEEVAEINNLIIIV